jgi:uncharacterized protein YgbK (DUF1537 family)
MQLNYHDRISALPSFKEEDLKARIKAHLNNVRKVIIVLDDDPTGTQTVHNVPVLTVWDVDSIEKELINGSRLFYILTNSRSMSGEEADALHRLIGSNLANVFEKHHQEFIVISRGDSTLRGHFPNDIIALADGLQMDDFSTAVIPAFFEGGRLTIDDIHYVLEGGLLVPVAKTSFARDKTFGFSHSDLKEWIEEKSKGVIKASDVVSFSLEAIRKESTEVLAMRIGAMPQFSYCIVNAVTYHDVEKFALACLQSGVHMLFRTAASFVKAISGIEDKALLSKYDLVGAESSHGGLIVVGSYVTKTTNQLNKLLLHKSLVPVEIDVSKVLRKELEVSEMACALDGYLKEGKDVVLYTSRLLQFGTSELHSLAIGNIVSAFVTTLLSTLQTVPKFIIAKGGITSSDIATKSLGIKSAIVIGQALPGVPVWLAGDESKFPGLPYIIFPGNVGDDDALANLYEKLIDD